MGHSHSLKIELITCYDDNKDKSKEQIHKCQEYWLTNIKIGQDAQDNNQLHSPKHNFHFKKHGEESFTLLFSVIYRTAE
jgi:hypothetical protein